jgi:hypothetical protein
MCRVFQTIEQSGNCRKLELVNATTAEWLAGFDANGKPLLQLAPTRTTICRLFEIDLFRAAVLP